MQFPGRGRNSVLAVSSPLRDGLMANVLPEAN